MGRSGVGPAPVVMALGGVLLLGLAIHEYRVNGDIGLAGILEIAVGGLLFVWGVLFLFGKGHHATRLGFRMGKGGLAAAATVILLLVFAGLGAYVVMKGNLSVVPARLPSLGGSTTTANPQVPLELPIKFIFRNRLTGAAFNPTSAQLYNSKGYVVETLSVSNGVAVTSDIFKSGEQYYLKVVDGSAFYFVPVYVPFYNADIAKIRPPDYHIISVDATDVPTNLTVKVIDATGVAVSTINAAAPTPLTVMVTNVWPNTGLPGSFSNPITHSTYSDYLVITVTGSGAVIPRVSNAQLVFQTTGKAVYVVPLSGLDCRTDPRTGQATPVSKSFGITLDPTGVPAGSYSVVVTAYTDLDANYLHSYGVPNSDAVSLGSVTLTVNVS